MSAEDVVAAERAAAAAEAAREAKEKARAEVKAREAEAVCVHGCRTTFPLACLPLCLPACLPACLPHFLYFAAHWGCCGGYVMQARKALIPPSELFKSDPAYSLFDEKACRFYAMCL